MKNCSLPGRNAFAFGCLLTPLLAFSALAQGPTTPTATPADTDAPRLEVQTPAEGFTLFNGKMYRIANGQAVPVTEEKTLRISSSGATDLAGQPLKIPAGSMLTVDGRLVPIPGGIRFTDGSAATTDPNPPPATPANAGAAADRASLPPLGGNPGYPDRGVTGENLSGLAPATGNPASSSGSAQQSGQNMTSPGAAGSGGSDRSTRSSADRDPNGGVANPGLPVIIRPGTGVSGGIPGENAVNSGAAAGGTVTNPVINPAATNTGATGTTPGARSTDFNSNTTNPNAVPARGANATQPSTGAANQTPGSPASNEINNRRNSAAGQGTGTSAGGTRSTSGASGTSSGAGTRSGSGSSTGSGSNSGAGTGTAGQ